MAEKKKSQLSKYEAIKCSVYGYQFAPCAVRICTHPAVVTQYGHDGKAWVSIYVCRKCRFAVRNDYDGGLQCRWKSKLGDSIPLPETGNPVTEQIDMGNPITEN